MAALRGAGSARQDFLRSQDVRPPCWAPSVQQPDLRQEASLGPQWSLTHFAGGSWVTFWHRDEHWL